VPARCARRSASRTAASVSTQPGDTRTTRTPLGVTSFERALLYVASAAFAAAYVLIEAGGYSGTAAGAALLPFPLVLALTSPAMGALAGRTGSKLSLTIGPLIVAAGFLLLLRLGSHGNYWADVLPGLFVIAIGMAGAVAPLTTAVLTSVDSRHTGSASGFNSAVARTGGLVATALLGAVLAATGTNLIGKFHVAVIVCAAVSIAASASAFGLIKNNQARDSLWTNPSN
jgi:MFS family permease